MSSLTEECCKPGNEIDREVTGQMAKIGDIDCYIVGDSPHVILVTTDIFGPTTDNARYNADYLAKEGFTVVVPDLFHGDPANAELMKNASYLRGEWLPRHPLASTIPMALKVAKDILNQDKYISIQAQGYCYGAPHVFALTEEGLAKTGVVSHASFLTKADAARVMTPFLFNCAEQDHAFTEEIKQHFMSELRHKADVSFVTYPGTTHGFAARGELGGERSRALEQTAKFFKQHV